MDARERVVLQVCSSPRPVCRRASFSSATLSWRAASGPAHNSYSVRPAERACRKPSPMGGAGVPAPEIGGTGGRGPEGFGRASPPVGILNAAVKIH